jgi:hypothetical protein
LSHLQDDKQSIVIDGIEAHLKLGAGDTVSIYFSRCFHVETFVKDGKSLPSSQAAAIDPDTEAGVRWQCSALWCW